MYLMRNGMRRRMEIQSEKTRNRAATGAAAFPGRSAERRSKGEIVA